MNTEKEIEKLKSKITFIYVLVGLEFIAILLLGIHITFG